MALPRSFVGAANFRMAFDRILRGSNRDYKRFYRHLLPTYGVAIEDVARDLSAVISRGEYEPATPTLVFVPKPSGVLRPLSILTFTDLLVYQAIGNTVADAFERELGRFNYVRSYGPIYAGRGSAFFFRSWKRAYSSYNATIRRNFDAGYTFVADFDLVACYELIDHNLLRRFIGRKVKNVDFLDFVTRCLSVWTTNLSLSELRHGVPQGPETSALLADIVLSRFDAMKFKNARYVRYVDDIKIMARSEIPLRRALVRLDLQSKDLGLVPQAQKIQIREVASVEELLKTVPSPLLSREALGEASSASELMSLFRQSQRKTKGRWEVTDATKFKYALSRLGPRQDVLKRIGQLLISRSDLAHLFAAYLRQFGESREAADLLLAALKQDPTYDHAAAAYIEALDVCEPADDNSAYRRVIQTATRRSEEKTITLRTAALVFRGKRAGSREAVRLIDREPHPLARGLVLSRLFGDAPEVPYRTAEASAYLEFASTDEDADLAIYATDLRVRAVAAGATAWKPPAAVHSQAKLLLRSLGLRQRLPSRRGILREFFRRRGLPARFPFRRALGRDFREAERRCLRLQTLLIGDPTARIMMLDTFNELLLQSFSKNHPALAAAYTVAAGANPNPDYGNWLNNGRFVSVLPNAVRWLRRVHSARVQADLAHAREKKGTRAGKPTRPISYGQADKLLLGFTGAWSDILRTWAPIL